MPCSLQPRSGEVKSSLDRGFFVAGEADRSAAGPFAIPTGMRAGERRAIVFGVGFMKQMLVTVNNQINPKNTAPRGGRGRHAPGQGFGGA